MPWGESIRQSGAISWRFSRRSLLEALALPVYLALADLGNRTHVLLLIATVATYTIIGLGLVALGAHVNRNTLRILRAVQLAAEARPRT